MVTPSRAVLYRPRRLPATGSHGRGLAWGTSRSTEGQQHDSEADNRHRRDPRRGSRAHGLWNEPRGSDGYRWRGGLRHEQGHADHRNDRAPLGWPVCPRPRYAATRPTSPWTRPTRSAPCPATSWRSSRRTTRPLPQVANQAATKLASDPNVVGVVGTLNSSTSQTVQPILSERDIVQISPANTGPALTLGDNPSSPKRPFDNYFRVATTDLIQGPFAANYLVQTAGKKNIAVIDDGKTYGSGLAEQFSQQATKLGAKVVAREKVGERDTDFSGVIAKIRAHEPGRRLLRRRVPGGRSAVRAARGRRPQRPADGRRRHRRRRSSSRSAGGG